MKPPVQDISKSLPETIDRRYFAELFPRIESCIDVNAIQIDDTRIWPLVRWILARNVKRPGGVDTRDLATKVTSVQKSALTPVEQRAQKDEYACRELDVQFNHLRKMKDVDFVVMTKSEKYYQKIGGKKFSPITDPIFEDLAGYGRAVVMALGPIDFDCVHPPFKLDDRPHMLLSRNIPLSGDIEDARQRMQSINDLLKELNCKLELDVDLVIKRFQRYVRKRAYWHEVFKILNPKIVFVSSFVGWAHLIWACRDLGITTVDIQHGGQSAFHYHTSHWTKVPDEGYPFLPDFFWVWGETTAANIHPWLPGGAKRHMALVGGNRNLARWIRTEADNSQGELEKSVQDASQEFSKKILLTLGYALEEVLPDCVVEAMQLRKDWFWFIRLHPLKRAPEVISGLVSRLESLGLINFEISKTTDARLFNLFRIVDHHVTPFSTSGREALALGVPTTIVHPIGLTYFSEDIDTGIFDYADSGEVLVNSIESFHLPDGIDPQTVLATDDFYMADALRQIQKYSKNNAG